MQNHQEHLYSIAGIVLRFDAAFPSLGGSILKFKTKNADGAQDISFHLSRETTKRPYLYHALECSRTSLWEHLQTGESLLHVSAYGRPLNQSTEREVWTFKCSSDYSKVTLHISDTFDRRELQNELNSRCWLERIVSSALSGSQKFLFHGALIQHSQFGGIVFYGDSGVGKSTISALLQNADMGKVIADDKIICQHSTNGFLATGTPWNRSCECFNNNISTPVNYLIRLAHGKTNNYSTLSFPDFIQTYARQIIVSNRPNTNENLVWKLKLSHQSFHSVAHCATLKFVPNMSVCNYLAEAIKEGA